VVSELELERAAGALRTRDTKSQQDEPAHDRTGRANDDDDT